jgi:AraC family transcriptional regulator
MELVASRSDPPLRGMSRRVAAAFAILDAILGACPETRLGLEAIGEARRLGPALACIEARVADAELRVQDLARSLELSTSRLHALFTRVLGLSPTAYLRRRRMAKAEGLLVGSDLLVREIAARCGWDDEFHFSRMFKRVHGISPLGYRQRRTHAGI